MNRTNKMLIVTHKHFNGAGQDLFKFLKSNRIPSMLIEHNFSSSYNRMSVFSYYDGKKKCIKETFDYKLLPDYACYIKDFIYTLFGILPSKNKYHIAVGCGGFNALACLLLKKFGKARKAIFYTIDYVPKRFDNKLMNKIYHLIDKICVKYCDETWNLSPKMAEARRKYNNMPKREYNRQKVVPIGIWLEELPKNIRKSKDKRQLIFVGHLLEKQGVQLVLKAIPNIAKRIPNFNFMIIGDGDYKKELTKIVDDLKIHEYVKFKGAIYDKDKINTLLGNSHLAIAMYDKKLDRFTKYADPTKLKTYLAMGIPILMTDVPYNAKEIESCRCGKIVEYDAKELEKSICSLMGNNEILKEYSRNASRYMQKYDWNIIFKDNIHRISEGGII